MQRFNEQKETSIIEDYKAGKTTVEIANKWNTYNTSIRRVLLRNGIIPRTTQRVNRLCKHNPFKRKDEESDYFLGLLLTDGCITAKSSNNYVINLSLSGIDGYMVEHFRDWASPKTKVSKMLQKLNNSYMYSCNIMNEEAVEWLRRKGNFYRKSYECKIYIPLNWNILRGIFDGDGGFRKAGETRLSFFICGKSKVFINQIEKFLIKEGFRPKVICQRGLYYVSIYRQAEVELLGLKLYNNAHVFLHRKHDKWLAFYENRRANGVNSGKEMAIQP